MSPQNRPNLRRSILVEETLEGLSPIQTIMKMAEARNIREMGLDPDDVISFGGGWCNHAAPDALVDAYREIVNDRAQFHASGRYSAIAGDLECRRQLCRFEASVFGLNGLEPANIILGQSSTQLFSDTLRTIADPGDDIAFFDPTYANYANAVKCALKGSKMRFVPALDPDRWSYLDDAMEAHSLDTLKTRAEEGVRALVVPVPDNPTSQIPNDRFLRAAREIFEDAGGYLVVDHAYKTLWFGDMPRSFAWSPIEHPNLITIHSNSKWLSSLGRRLGWVEASEAVAAGLEKLNESSLLSPDTLHSMATARFIDETLEDGALGRYIEDTRTLYMQTAEVLVDAIDDLLGWRRLKPQGGLYTCCPTPDGEEPFAFVNRTLEATGVLLIPGTGFGPSMARAVRLSYGPLCYDHDRIREGIQRVADYIGGQ